MPKFKVTQSVTMRFYLETEVEADDEDAAIEQVEANEHDSDDVLSDWTPGDWSTDSTEAEQIEEDEDDADA